MVWCSPTGKAKGGDPSQRQDLHEQVRIEQENEAMQDRTLRHLFTPRNAVGQVRSAAAHTEDAT